MPVKTTCDLRSRAPFRLGHDGVELRVVVVDFRERPLVAAHGSRALLGRRSHGAGGPCGSSCLVVPSPHGIVLWVGRRRPLVSLVHATAALLGKALVITVADLLVTRCSVCSADGGFHGPGRDRAAVVEERLLGQGDRVAQLLLDGSLRGAQRGLQLGGIAIVAMANVHLYVHATNAAGERRGEAVRFE